MDFTQTVAGNSIRYLDTIADDSNLHPILKTYYLTKCKSLQLKSSFKLPSKQTDSTARCPRCCTKRSLQTASYGVEPEPKKGRFIRRLLKKQTEGRLTMYQTKCLNKLKRGNAYVITCKMCKKQVRKRLVKPEKSVKEITELPVKKKIKKQKDLFVGLNKEAVLSATPKGLKRKHEEDKEEERKNNEEKRKTIQIETPKVNTSKKEVSIINRLKNEISNINTPENALSKINTPKKETPKINNMKKSRSLKNVIKEKASKKKEERKQNALEQKKKKSKMNQINKRMSNVLMNQPGSTKSPSASLKQFLKGL